MSENRVFAKCAWHLLPLILPIYIVNYLDRVNVGFAALTMNKDLGFSPTVFGIGGGILFAGYSLCQVPANFVLSRVGARRWMFCIIACWGLISASCALVRSPSSFYVLRFFLGVAEAGFFPGMAFYLTTWFPREYRGRIIASFTAGIPLSFVIGGPVSSLLLQLDGTLGLHGWQWLFLLEGTPALLLSFALLAFLSDGPADARWLTDAEKQTIAVALANENSAAPRAYWPVLRDWRVLVLGMIQFCFGGAIVAYLLWLPQIVRAMGFSTLSTGFIVAGIFAVFVPSMVLWGRHSDSTGERIWHIAISALLAAFGFALAGAVHDVGIGLFALTCAGLGLFLNYGPSFSLPSLLLQGPAVACAIALVNSIGTTGSFVAPIVVGVLKEQTGTYSTPLTVLAVVMLGSAVITLALGRALGARLATTSAKPARA